jgi:FkbM family methyltransferase
LTERFVSYAQHGEDVVIWRALGNEGPGFYVDVGAFDPTEDSVTRALYERGWRGVNIEPQAGRLAGFERDRPDDLNLSMAIGARDGEATLYVPDVAGWATIETSVATALEASSAGIESQQVAIRTLASVFAEHEIASVDVLKIDVEGAEAAVVAGLDLDRVRPRVVLVEGVAPIIGRTAGDDAVNLLINAGYIHCMFDGLNHYLTSESRLVGPLSVPANPTDGWTPVAVIRYDAEREQQAHTRVELLETIARLEAAVEAATPKLPAHLPTGAVIARLVPPEVRTARRRTTFVEHLASPPSIRTLTEKPARRAEAVNRLVDAFHTGTPSDAVAALYLAVLQRTPDADGLQSWSERLAAGTDLLSLAQILNDSDEARALDPAHRRGVAREISALRARRALEELGDPHASSGGALTPGRVADELFVRALYDVCLGREPTGDELVAEVAGLRAGVGRELLIRAFARRNETWQQLFGTHRGGLRARWWYFRGRRQAAALVRERVAAAEQRQIAFLLASLTESVSVWTFSNPENRVGRT